MTLTHLHSGVNRVSNLGVVDPGKNISKANFRKISIFSGNFRKKFDFKFSNDFFL